MSTPGAAVCALNLREAARSPPFAASCPVTPGFRADARSYEARRAALRARGSLPTSSRPTALPAASAGRRASVSPPPRLNDPQPFLDGPQPSSCPARSAARCQCPCGLGWSHAPGRGWYLVARSCFRAWPERRQVAAVARSHAETPSAGRGCIGTRARCLQRNRPRRVGVVVRSLPSWSCGPGVRQEYSPPSVGCIP
jgi:hypothetical protein